MNRALIILLLSFLSYGLSSGEPVSLQEAVSIALKSNPQLAAARFEIEAAKARSMDAGKAPNPEIEMALRRSQAEGQEREGSAFLGFSQRFPVTDRLRQRREVRLTEIELAQAEVGNAERLHIAEVLRQAVEFFAAHDRVLVLQELEQQTADYVTVAEQRLSRAEGSELDLASAETERVLALQAAQQAEAEVRKALAELKPLLGLPPSAPLQLAGDLSSSIHELRGTLQITLECAVNRPDVLAAQLRLARAQRALQLARAERWEDWELEAGYENERSVDEPVGPERDHFFGVGLRIPLPLRNRGEGRMAEAAAEVAKADQLLAASQLAANAEVSAEREACLQARAQVHSLQTRVLPLIREREAMTRDAYAKGTIDFTPVLQLQQQQTRLREALVDAQRNHALALVRLQAAQGSHSFLSQPAK
ncbi:MAG: TolC family protein [Verrucomicrobiota bacterium]